MAYFRFLPECFSVHLNNKVLSVVHFPLLASKQQQFFINRMSFLITTLPRLEQSTDYTIFINVYLLCCRYLRKSWHSHNISCKNNYKSSSCSYFYIFYGNSKSFRGT